MSQMHRLNDFFDQIYVVTIERNVSRRTAIDEELKDISFCYFYGADGRLLPAEEICASYDDVAAQRTYGRSLSLGQIGCALSHRWLYQEILDRGHERVLILEDDIYVCRENVRLIQPVLSQLPQDWDLLYLCTRRPAETPWLLFKTRYVYPALHASRLRRYPMEDLRTRYSRPYSRNLRAAGRHWLTAAYAVTRSAAARLLELQTPVRTVSDGALAALCATAGNKAFLSAPNIFSQRAGTDSSIWNRPARALTAVR